MIGYDPGAEAVLFELQHSLDPGEMLNMGKALRALLRVSPAKSVMVRALNDSNIWPEATRRYWVETIDKFLDGDHQALLNNWHWQGTGAYFSMVEAECRSLAAADGAPVITEWHLASTLAARLKSVLPGTDLRAEIWLDAVRQAYRIVDLSDEDREKGWLICDTNVFIEYRFFDEFDWHTHFGYPAVVLVVPTIVIQEMERLRREGQREQARQRARNVRPRLVRHGLSTPRNEPGVVRAGVELLLLDLEPLTFPDTLDPSVADDRVIATALDFRWRRQGAKVAIVSGDLQVLLKARAHGLAFHDLDGVETAERVA